MSCIPCQKARAAMAQAVREAASGNLRAAAAQAPRLADALGEKTEAVRVRVFDGNGGRDCGIERFY
jgi:hypothetical protein